MRTMQQKYLGRIESIAKLQGLEAIQVVDYGNTGTIHIQDEKSIESMVEVRYNFQSKNVTFSLTVNGVKIPSQPGRDDYFDYYMQYSETCRLNKFFNLLTACLEDL